MKKNNSDPAETKGTRQKKKKKKRKKREVYKVVLSQAQFDQIKSLEAFWVKASI